MVGIQAVFDERFEINWSDWYNNETLQAMVDGEFLDFIVDKIFIPIKEKDVFIILNRY